MIAVPDALRRFDVAFLNAGSRIGHTLDSETLTWWVYGRRTQFVQPYAYWPLTDDLHLLAFTKVVGPQVLDTYLVVDAGRGHAFDATYSHAQQTWRFDRGSLGMRLRLPTASMFPRISSTDDPFDTVFALDAKLALRASADGPELSIARGCSGALVFTTHPTG